MSSDLGKAGNVDVPRSTMRKATAYCGGELGRLGGLSALLANGRQWRIDGGDIVGGEAAVEVRRAGVVRGSAHLGAVGAAKRAGDGSERRLSGVAGGLEGAALSNAGREGHNCYKYTAAIWSASFRPKSVRACVRGVQGGR